MNHFPLYFYPTTIYFVDDNERFLKNNILGLNPIYQYRQFVEPELAFNELMQNTKPTLNEQQLIDWAILDTYDMFSPQYDNPQNEKTIRKWMKDMNFDKIETLHSTLLVARGVKKRKI